MLYKKTVLICMLIVILLFNTGCWDKVEIDDRAFVISIAIDKTEQAGDTTQQMGRFTISMGMPIVGKLVESGGGEKAYTIVTGQGDTLFDARNNLARRVSRKLYLDHAKVILLSDQLFEDKNEFKEIVDGLLRDYEINRKMYIAIVKGKAKDVLEVDNPLNKLVMKYLTGVMDNADYNSGIRKLYLDEFIRSLNKGGKALIPIIEPGENDVKMTGSAVISNFELKGWLEQEEDKYSLFIEKGIRGTNVDVKYNGIIVPYQIDNSVRVIKYDGIQHKGNMKFTILFKVEGEIRDYIFGDKLMDQKKLQNLNDAVEAEIEKLCKHVISLYQNKFKVDMLGIDEYMDKYHHKIWEKVENNWQQYFCNADIDVQAECYIRTVGVVK